MRKKLKAAALLSAVMMVLSGCAEAEPAQEETVKAYTAAETSAEESTEPLEKYIITCAELAYKTMNDVKDDLPSTMEVTDETMLSDVLRYDMSLADDHCVYMQMLSTDLFELTVIRAPDENKNLVMAMLDSRRNYLRDQAAFYPEQKRAADATVVGGLDGVYYLICHEKADEMEKKLMYYILRN